jgi:hypothetical protein
MSRFLKSNSFAQLNGGQRRVRHPPDRLPPTVLNSVSDKVYIAETISNSQGVHEDPIAAFQLITTTTNHCQHHLMLHVVIYVNGRE